MKIQLPHFVLADLYRESLVIVDDAIQSNAAGDQQNTEPAFFLGNNQKQISVLVNDQQQLFTDNESLQLLTNMLGALGMALDDVALINIDKTNINYKDMQATLQTRACLMFEVPTQRIGLPFQMPDYKVQTFGDCKYLCSASLHKMKGDGKEAKLAKTKLWMCLKSLFE